MVGTQRRSVHPVAASSLHERVRTLIREGAEMTEVVEETAQERAELAEQAHELDQAIREGLRAGRRALWEVAENLYEFDEIAGWIPLGYENKTEWLADSEISMTAATYYRLTAVWREMVVIRKVDLSTLRDLDVSKVQVVLPKLQMGKVRLKEALNDAEALGARDLRDKYARPPRVLEPSDEVEALSDDESDAVAVEEPEEGGDGSEEPEDLRTAENGSKGDRGKIDREKRTIVKQALKDWEVLQNELLVAAESGQTHPRIDVKLIRAGVQGANLLIEQWRLSNGRNGK
jgi:hypothetical protein